MITHADALFSLDDVPHARGVLPPGSAITRAGNISYRPVEDGPKPGSSRTKIQILKPGEDKPKSPKVGLQTPVFESEEPVMPVPTFTPDEELDLLFDPTIIPQSLRDAIGDAYHVSSAILMLLRS